MRPIMREGELELGAGLHPKERVLIVRDDQIHCCYQNLW